MLGNIQETNDFHAIIKRPRPAVFKFWATWSGPSQGVADFYKKLSTDYPGMDFYDIDVDAQPELKNYCGISKVPTFVVFKAGERVESVMGSNLKPLKDLVIKHALNA